MVDIVEIWLSQPTLDLIIPNWHHTSTTNTYPDRARYGRRAEGYRRGHVSCLSNTGYLIISTPSPSGHSPAVGTMPRHLTLAEPKLRVQGLYPCLYQSLPRDCTGDCINPSSVVSVSIPTQCLYQSLPRWTSINHSNNMNQSLQQSTPASSIEFSQPPFSTSSSTFPAHDSSLLHVVPAPRLGAIRDLII